MSMTSTRHDVLSDADVRDRIRRIRERYGGASEEANAAAAPLSLPLPMVQRTAAEERRDSDSAVSAIVGRLESTVQRLQRRTAERTDAQTHLEQLVASLSKQRPPRAADASMEGEGGGRGPVAVSMAVSIGSPAPQGDGIPLSPVGGAAAAAAGSPTSFGRVVLAPRRVLSQCRPVRVCIRLTVPLLLRYPILFPSLDTVGVSLVLPLDAMMETTGDDLTLRLLRHVADLIVQPALDTSSVMDSSAALINISLRGVRETLLLLQHPAEAAKEFCAVLPSAQRRSCLASAASAVEGAPAFVAMHGAGMLVELPVLRTWAQRLWALLRLRAEAADPASEDPVVIDMFLLERDALRNRP